MKKILMATACAAALTSCGGGSGGGGGGGGGTSNRPPSFTLPASLDYVENSGTDVATLTASDPDGDAVSFSIASGKDGQLFRVVNGNALAFADPLSFETPLDANRDNVYEVDVVASDGRANVTRSISVRITNSKEGLQTVRRIEMCPGSRATSSSYISDFEFLVGCENGRIMNYDIASRTSRLIVDTSVARPGEKLIEAYFYDAFFRRIFVTTQASNGTWYLVSYKIDFSSGSRVGIYEGQLTSEALTTSSFLRTTMIDCFNNDVCLLAGDTSSGVLTNALTAFTVTEDFSGNLQWTRQTLVTGMNWPGDMTRVERSFFITERDNSQIGRYLFDGNTFTDEARLDSFSNGSSLRPIEFYDGSLPSITGNAITGDEFGKILTVGRMALEDGMLDGMGIEDRTLDFEPDTGPFGPIAAIQRATDTLFIIELTNGVLYEVTDAR